MKADHVIFNGGLSRLECHRCGFEQLLPLPRSASRVLAAMSGFVARHRDCHPRPALTVRTDRTGEEVRNA